MYVRSSSVSEDRYLARAAFYGLYLRRQGYDPDEAAVLVMRRYPRVRPWLEKQAQTRERTAQETA